MLNVALALVHVGLQLFPFPLNFSISLTPAANSLPTSLAVSETGLMFSFATIKIDQGATLLDTTHSHGIPHLK